MVELIGLLRTFACGSTNDQFQDLSLVVFIVCNYSLYTASDVNCVEYATLKEMQE